MKSRGFEMNCLTRMYDLRLEIFRNMFTRSDERKNKN
jgi:hypothetical protein